MTNARRWTALAALAVAAGLLVGWLPGRDGKERLPAQIPSPSERAERIAAGKLSYEVYCASCHGETGQGSGPVAQFLNVRPTDLTRLAAEPGGEFPADRVARAIDGREEVRGHGPGAMPVWGLSFELRERDVGRQGEVREQIRDLALYLESIQERPPR
jgi:mono/diheme cytochrome c family protein